MLRPDVAEGAHRGMRRSDPLPGKQHATLQHSAVGEIRFAELSHGKSRTQVGHMALPSLGGHGFPQCSNRGGTEESEPRCELLFHMRALGALRRALPAFHNGWWIGARYKRDMGAEIASAQACQPPLAANRSTC